MMNEEKPQVEIDLSLESTSINALEEKIVKCSLTVNGLGLHYIELRYFY